MVIKDTCPQTSVEETVIIQVQKFSRHYRVVKILATILSRFGEHALGWIGISVLGALCTRKKATQRRWMDVGIAAVAAHGVSIILKRLIRRKRPSHPAINTHPTAGRYSFPSSHASGAAGAAVILSSMMDNNARIGVFPVLVGSMMIARLEHGVHFMSDLIAGAIIGWLSAQIVKILRHTERIK